MTFAKEFGETVPASFESRRSTFKEKLSIELSDVYEFYQPVDRDIHERQMLLIPIKFRNKMIADQYFNQLNCQPSPSCDSDADDSRRNMIHSALKIHSELESKPGHVGFNVSYESAMAIVPKSLLMYLSVLIHGQDAVEKVLDDDEANDMYISDEDGEDDDGDESDSDSDEDSDDNLFKKNPAVYTNKILSIAQDIIYVASRGKKITPKHIGLAVTLHHKRSQKLVTLFNRAGHCLTYRQLLQVYTSLAEVTLDTLDYSTGAVIPSNLIPYPSKDPQENPEIELLPIVPPFLHITADNIDKITDTLDGKKSFHGTQMVVFQRGAKSTDQVLNTLKMKQKVSLQVPEIMNEIFEPEAQPREEPVLTDAANLDWYAFEPKSDSVKVAESKDLAFIISRENMADDQRIGWTEHNKLISTNHSGITASAFMPLILNPAHEYGTLNTVLIRGITLADRLNYEYIVVTVDQALYCKLLELRWSSEIYQKRVILRMGGLHIAMNYLRAIGQHMRDSGLSEIWIESGVLGAGSVEKVLEGKAYSKAMRVHKLTYQALWRILMPRFFEYLEKSHKTVSQKLKDVIENNKDLTDFLMLDDNRKVIDEFLAQDSKRDPNSKFWIIYMSFISTLLKFTRSLRDGEFHLYLSALNEMLPLLARYDHFKYLQSLTAYIYDMNHLPEKVLRSFEQGEFVVKRSQSNFNQVDPDHAQEWLVRTCKDSGGLLGMMNKDKSMQKWILSFHWKTEISQRTYSMFGYESRRVEMSKGLIKRNQSDENSILHILKDFDVLSAESKSSVLQNVATKDLATESIETSLLNAIEYGKEQVIEFVKERFIPDDSGQPLKSFLGITKNMPLTMTDLKKKVLNKPMLKNIAKTEINILQRLVTAFESGRSIDLMNILIRELQKIPLSVAEVNGDLRSGDDSSFIIMLRKNVQAFPSINNDRNRSHLIIDAEKVILSMGKLEVNVKSFGDFFEAFLRKIKALAKYYQRIDLIFNRYNAKSIKRVNASAPLSSVRRVIQNERVPLPKNWKQYWANNENKADLAQFLSKSISTQSFENTDVVVSAGFEDQIEVYSSNKDIDVVQLKATHELAVTRIILHSVHSSANTIIVSTNDTNVYVLLIRHYEKFKCEELWLETESRKKTLFLPIHTMSAQFSPALKANLLAYHAILGCDTTSYLAGITKSGGWKLYEKYYELLSGFRNDSYENAKQAAEQFVVKLYKVEQGADTTNVARYILFRKLKQLDKLPPTSDTLDQHLKRAFYQSTIWENSNLCTPTSLIPDDYGWNANESGYYEPVLMTLSPITGDCLKVISCGCKGQCASKNCKCRKNQLPCTVVCNCVAPCKNPFVSVTQNIDEPNHQQ